MVNTVTSLPLNTICEANKFCVWSSIAFTSCNIVAFVSFWNLNLIGLQNRVEVLLFFNTIFFSLASLIECNWRGTIETINKSLSEHSFEQ